MLLERQDVGPNTVGTRHNRVPLLLAAMGGTEGIVGSPFAREDINPNIVDTRYSRITLGCAAAGEGGVQKLWGYYWNERISIPTPSVAERSSRRLGRPAMRE